MNYEGFDSIKSDSRCSGYNVNDENCPGEFDFLNDLCDKCKKDVFDAMKEEG